MKKRVNFQLNAIASQATSAFVVETKLLVYNDNYDGKVNKNKLAKLRRHASRVNLAKIH